MTGLVGAAALALGEGGEGDGSVTLTVEAVANDGRSLEGAMARLFFDLGDNRVGGVVAEFEANNEASVVLPELAGRGVEFGARAPHSEWILGLGSMDMQVAFVTMPCENRVELPDGVTEYRHVIHVHPAGAANGRIVDESGKLIRADWIATTYRSQINTAYGIGLGYATDPPASMVPPGLPNLRVFGLVADRPAHLFIWPSSEGESGTNTWLWRRFDIPADQAGAAPDEGDLGDLVIGDMPPVVDATLNVAVRPLYDGAHFHLFPHSYGVCFVPADRRSIVEVLPELVVGYDTHPQMMLGPVTVTRTLLDGREVEVYDRTIELSLPEGTYDVVPGIATHIIRYRSALFGDAGDLSERPPISGVPRVTITAGGPNVIDISADEFVAAQEALDGIGCYAPTVAREVGADGDAGGER